MTLFQMVRLAMFAAGITPDWSPSPQIQMQETGRGTVKKLTQFKKKTIVTLT